MTARRSLLGLSVPLIQAGMGGVSGPRLAAAVSNAGAGGVVALYRNDAPDVAEDVRRTRAATPHPFGVNLIPEVAGAELAHRQMEAATRELPDHGFVTCYGLPTPSLARQATARGHRLVVQVGDAAAAERAAGLGAHAVVLQGTEAGGHLLGSTPVLELLAAARARAVDAALLVAGGITCGPQLAAAMLRGAAGAMCGTAFVATHESDAHPDYKRCITRASAEDTEISDLFDFGWPGRVHRVLRNRVTAEGRALPAAFIARTTVGTVRHPIPRFSATVPTRHTTGTVAEMAMYCGLGCTAITGIRPAAEVVTGFADAVATQLGPRERPSA